jgi:hypothetical protein
VEHQISRHAVLERYLNLATRGLWGQKKLEVRRELDGNIREMALEYSIAGLNETESIQRALQEFGAPQKVSVGMSNVYLIPSMIRKLALAGVLSSFGVVAFNSSAAQTVPVSFSSAEFGWIPKTAYFEIKSLQKKLSEAGIKNAIKTKSLEVTFPGSKPISVDVVSEITVAAGPVKPDAKYGQQFVAFDDLVLKLQAANSGLIKLEGWGEVKLTVGKTSLKFGSMEQPVSPYSLLGVALGNALKLSQPEIPQPGSSTSLFDTMKDGDKVTVTDARGQKTVVIVDPGASIYIPKTIQPGEKFTITDAQGNTEVLILNSANVTDKRFTLSLWGTNPGCKHEIKIGKPGDVYALLSRTPISYEFPATKTDLKVIDVSPVHARGMVLFRVPHDQIQFTKQPEAVGNVPLEAERTMLVRMTGNLNGDQVFEPVLPAEKVSRNTPGFSCL